jgi:hypothetical protein
MDIQSLGYCYEEKMLYAALFYRIHKDVVMDPLSLLYVYTHDPKLQKLSSFCLDRGVEAGVTGAIAETCPISRYVWDNMDSTKKSYFIDQLNKLEKEVGGSNDGSLGFITYNTMSKIFSEVGILFGHDSNGFRFK